MGRRPSTGSAWPLLAITALGLALGWTPVEAETLPEAIAFAYQSNPTLQSARAQLRATDETYIQARSAYGPTIQLQGVANYNNDRLRRSFSGDTALPSNNSRTNLGQAEVVVEQPLYSGGRTTLEIQGAEERIRAGREALRASEQNIVFAVVQAYEDVRRDRQSIVARQTNLAALIDQLKETRARMRAGEVTQTDTSQAEAQVQAEEANVALAENQLLASEAEYTTAVGRNPGILPPPPPLPGLPANATEAFDLGGRASPDFLQALDTERVSRTAIQIARTEERPTVLLRGTYGYSASLSPLNYRNRDRALTGQAVVTIPFFSSGRIRSDIRQAAELNGSDRLSIESARRLMVQNIADAWNQMIIYDANIARETAQVDAAATAFKGMRIEYRAGQRSTLDVLIAEETLRDAELAKLAAQHDAYVSQALVLRYIGRLDARDIIEDIPAYDPAAHLRAVEHRGALPWEPLIRFVDGIGAPPAGQRSINAPLPARTVQLAPGHGPTGLDTVARFPIAPVPGTISNIAPPQLPDETLSIGSEVGTGTGAQRGPTLR